MWNKETLSRVSEQVTTVKRTRTAAVTAQPSPAEPADRKPAAEHGSLPDPQTLQNALGNLSAHVQNLHRSLQFSVDQESGDTVVKVVDAETKEVIRQIPSEELLAIAQRLRAGNGVLLTEQV